MPAEPDDQGEVKDRAARLADRFPPPFKNDNQARARYNAVPPDLSLIVKARGYDRGFPYFIFDLFTAAIVPALLAIALNLAAIAVAVRLSPDAAPVSLRVEWRARWAALRKAAPALILILGVFGGLYSGVFTVSEAASVAAGSSKTSRGAIWKRRRARSCGLTY